MGFSEFSHSRFVAYRRGAVFATEPEACVTLLGLPPISGCPRVFSIWVSPRAPSTSVSHDSHVEFVRSEVRGAAGGLAARRAGPRILAARGPGIVRRAESAKAG